MVILSEVRQRRISRYHLYVESKKKKIVQTYSQNRNRCFSAQM